MTNETWCRNEASNVYTSTISTEPACSNSPASWALSTVKGRLPTNTLRSSENSAEDSSVSTSDDTATAKGASECLQPAAARARSWGSFAGKNADGAGLREEEEEEEEEGSERNWGEREVEKRVAAMGGIGRIGLIGFWG